MINRCNDVSHYTLCFGNLKIYLMEPKVVSGDNNEVRLTKLEYDLLVYLAHFHEGVNRTKPVKDPYGWGAS